LVPKNLPPKLTGAKSDFGSNAMQPKQRKKRKKEEIRSNLMEC
jgi:hypothetical protein